MGVRGLTTFIANRSHLYLENYELHNTNLVLDGNNIASQLYKWHCKCNDCFGGDYDKYANVIKNFFQLLNDCNIIPLVVFDGGYEKRKLRTVYSRMQNKINAVKQFNTATEGSATVFPLFLRELFMDIILKLEVKCVRCDFEGDNDIACIARTLQCPVLSYDSDFYIFDVLYIPFSTVELKLCKNKDKINNYIPCKVYRVEKFLNSFGGLNKINLPILAVLLGNDYIRKDDFTLFYNHLKLPRRQKDQSDQQRRIKTVILWLKNETPESAIQKILGRFKMRRRTNLAARIRSIVEGYECVDSVYLKYLNVSITKDKMADDKNRGKIVEVEDIALDNMEEDVEEDGDGVEDNDEEEEGVEEEEEEDDDDDDDEEEDERNSTKLTKLFQENFRKCLYPPCFIDILVKNTYYSIPQVEDYTQEHSHTITLRIIAAIHKILTYPSKKQLICIARDEFAQMKKFIVPVYRNQVPTLIEIENMNLKSRQETILNILQIEKQFLGFLSNFPDYWSLLIISIKYWVSNSATKIELPYIYSIVLCGIVLNYVDKHLGFYRANKLFFSKFGNTPVVLKETVNIQKTITKSLEAIDFNDSVSCLKELIQYFQMDAKMKSHFKLFNRNIIHQLAEFQSCLLHIKYLNSLFQSPFKSFVISDFYDGTFLYNMTVNLKKRTSLEMYLKLLLKNSPMALNSMELIVNKIKENIEDDISTLLPKKRRKRKKSKKIDEVVEELMMEEESEDDGVVDANNRFALLSSSSSAAAANC